MRVLTIEDDPGLADMLRRWLTRAGHIVDVVANGEGGLERARGEHYDVVILDLTLPDIDGVVVARRLRSEGVATPILMLTARDALDDRLRGFDAGADDYLAKPFAFEELDARLGAVVRRGKEAPRDDRLVVGDLALDQRARTVTRGGRPLALAPKEFALLEYLMRHPGRVITRAILLEHVWDYGFDPFANVVDAAIRRLRRVVDADAARPLIHTVRGVGYKIQDKA